MERRTPREEAIDAGAQAGAEAGAQTGAQTGAQAGAREALAAANGRNRWYWEGARSNLPWVVTAGALAVAAYFAGRECGRPVIVVSGDKTPTPSTVPGALQTGTATATAVPREATATPTATEVLAKAASTATATATATAKPEATATPIVKIEQHKYVDIPLKEKESATLPAEFFTDGKVTVNKGDSVVTFKDGVKTIRRVVTYDNNANTGQMTLITSDGSVDVYSEWGSNITSQIEPINLVPFVEHNVDLMKQLGCEGEKRGGCKTVMIMILECKNGQVKEIRVNNMDQIKAFAESRAH